MKKQVTKKGVQTKNIQQKEEKQKLSPVFFFAVLAIIALPAYFRGLYFEKEQFIVYLCSLVLFIILGVYKMHRKDAFKLNTYLDYGLLGLVGIYVVSMIFSVNIRSAISEVLKYINYFMIYLMVKECIHDHKQVTWVLNAIMLGVTGISFIGIGAATGSFPYNGAYSTAENEQWINATLQYHNAFGAYVVCGLFLCYILYALSNKIWAKCLYSLAGFTMVVGLVYSYSRGAWLVFAIVFVILLALIWKRGIYHEVFILSVSMLVPMVISAEKFRAAMVQRQQLPAWEWFIIGFLACAVINLLLQFIKLYMGKLNISKKTINLVAIGAVAVVVIAAVVTVIATPGLVARFIPKDLLTRLQGINMSSQTVRERFVFYFDALEIVKHYPIFGAGGGAWASLYFMYQSYLYWSNQAHSYIMQIWVDTGTIGMLILLEIIVAFIWQAIINLKQFWNDREKYLMHVAIAMAAFSLIFHSFIDFDLSLSGITITLWALLAITAVFTHEEQQEKNMEGGHIKILPSYTFVPIGIMVILTFMFMVGVLSSESGDSYAKAGNATSAKDAYLTAAQFDPLMSNYKIQYAEVVLNAARNQKNQNSQSQQEMLDAKKMVDSALAINRFNAEQHARSGAFYFGIGMLDQALDLFDDAVRLQPLNPQNYQQKADANIKAFQEYVKEGNKDKQKESLQKVINIENDVKAANAGKLKPVELSKETQDMITQAKQSLAAL